MSEVKESLMEVVEQFNKITLPDGVEAMIIVSKKTDGKVETIIDGQVSNLSVMNLVRTFIERDKKFKVEVREMVLGDFIEEMKGYAPMAKQIFSAVSSMMEDITESDDNELDPEFEALPDTVKQTVKQIVHLFVTEHSRFIDNDGKDIPLPSETLTADEIKEIIDREFTLTPVSTTIEVHQALKFLNIEPFQQDEVGTFYIMRKLPAQD